MKQLPLTSELIGQIKAAVGEDVDPSGFAVFEAIALNTVPLPGKKGSLFERAVVSHLTLVQMANSINSGNTLPLVLNHNMEELSKGRVFKASVLLGDFGDPELRVQFFIEGSETDVIGKLNSGALDEVSVAFLASQILCSECEFDYRGDDATWQNLLDRTCNNGHTVGKDGAHVRLTGLDAFHELSLVNRGAAYKAKIVGKSSAKLNENRSAMSLAARGFDLDEIILTSSKGEHQVDPTQLITQLADEKTKAALAEKSAADLQTQLTAVTAEVADLKTKLAAAADAADQATELAEARTLLGDIFTRLSVAAGATAAEVKVPEKIADLKAGLEANTTKLTALIPVGGASKGAGEDDTTTPAANLAGFKTKR